MKTKEFPNLNYYNLPNISEIWFCQDIPLDNTYKNQFFFNSRQEQINWFKSKAKLKNDGTPYTYDNMTQIRLQGQIKVSNHVGNLQNVNYIMFHNPNFDNAEIERQVWYFAFVKGVEYVNPNNTLIEYELDVFQTWMNFWTLEPSYVARETPDNDFLFENTLPENLESGPMVVTGTKFFDLASKELEPNPGPIPIEPWVSCFYHTTAIPEGTNVDNRYWMPFNTKTFDTLDYGGMRTFFEQEGHTIIAGYLVPQWMIIDRVRNYQFTINQDFNNMFLDINYKPKNKKLYCYPYTYLEVDNNLGTTQELRWENWDTYVSPGVRDCKFSLYSVMGMSPEISLMPWNYLGNGNSVTGTLMLPYNDFPQIPWSSDAFNTWWDSNISTFRLQNNTAKAHSITNIASGGAGAFASGVSGGAQLVSGDFGGVDTILKGGIGGLSSAAHGTIDLISSSYAYSAVTEDLKRTSDSVGGFSPSSVFNYVHGRCGYTFRVKTIKREYAKYLDNFFTKYGYRVATLKSIDLRTLPRGYKYIQTQEANIVTKSPNGWRSGFPVGAIGVIKKAFDSGITIWKDPDKVGDYGDWLVS